MRGMEESLHSYVLDQLQKSKGHWPQVAKGSGVSIRTLSKVARREVEYPRINTLEQLSQYFREQTTV